MPHYKRGKKLHRIIFFLLQLGQNLSYLYYNTKGNLTKKIMYIKDQNSSDDNINAKTMMATSMEILWESVIEPLEKDMDEGQIATIGLIGVTFKLIAEKAYAYEQIMGEVPSEENKNDFSRN